ncbi:MAG: hypothetical protein ABH812_03355 [bacterium]
MVNISRRELDDYVFERLLSILYELVFLNQKEQDFKIFFKSIFSYPERIMLVKRIGIIYLLIKKRKNYEICNILKISSATLNKYVLLLDKNIESYDFFNKLIKKNKVMNFVEEIVNTLYGPGTPGTNWSNAKKTKRQIDKRKKVGI